jgi:hypothetical protein
MDCIAWTRGILLLLLQKNQSFGVDLLESAQPAISWNGGNSRIAIDSGNASVQAGGEAALAVRSSQSNIMNISRARSAAPAEHVRC